MLISIGNKIAQQDIRGAIMKDEFIPQEVIENRIYLIRGHKVMLDRHLADLYGVQTKVLNQSVKRNFRRFPDDFMFSLSRQEILRMSQFVTSSNGDVDANLKFAKNVNVFTEQGVAMLSTVLNSERAIEVNIAIMRVFVRIRKILSANKELAQKFEHLERKVGALDLEVKAIFDAIRKLMEAPVKKSKKIGFLK